MFVRVIYKSPVTVHVWPGLLLVFLTVLHQWCFTTNFLWYLQLKMRLNWPKFYSLHKNSTSTGWKPNILQEDLCLVTFAICSHMTSAENVAFGIAQGGVPKLRFFFSAWEELLCYHIPFNKDLILISVLISNSKWCFYFLLLLLFLLLSPLL